MLAEFWSVGWSRFKCNGFQAVFPFGLPELFPFGSDRSGRLRVVFGFSLLFFARFRPTGLLHLRLCLVLAHGVGPLLVSPSLVFCSVSSGVLLLVLVLVGGMSQV